MTEKRLILEIGTGSNLFGEDYTNAAIRAVQTACSIHRCRCTSRSTWTRQKCLSTAPSACRSRPR